MKNYLIFTLLFAPHVLFAQPKVNYLQTDWSGGSGYPYYDYPTVFFDHYEIDYTTVGELTANSNKKNSVNVPFLYKGKIYTSTVNGLMAFDKLSETWDFMTPNITYLDHAILRDTLYVMGIYKIYACDGSTNDYGLGPNGFKFHSNTPNSYIFCLDAVGDYLYYGGRVGSSGTAYKYNQTLKEWVQMGGNFTQGVYCFAEYEGNLYVGTHWYGEIYKWNGTSWTEVYDTSLMTVMDLIVHDGKLYASGITTAHSGGRIYEYDGTNWQTIYTGYGVRYMTIHDNKLYFSAHKSTPPGAVYVYDGTTSTQVYTLENEAYPVGLLSDDGNLYYGGIEHVYGGVNNSTLYKNGTSFYELYVRYLNSSTFTSFSGIWGDLSYDIQTPANTGVKLYVIGRENTEDWGVNREFIYTPNNTSIQPTDKELRYRAVLWSADANATAKLEEVRMQTGDFVSTSQLDFNENLQIFPNPNKGIFNIRLPESIKEGSNIKIYNYLGKKVFELKNTKQINANDHFELAFSDACTGIYILEIISENQKFRQKLVIQ